MRRLWRAAVRRSFNPLALFSWARRRLRNRRTHRQVVRELGLPGTSDVREIRVEDLNSPQAVELIGGLRPDVLVVFGTGLIRPDVYGLAASSAINVHTGLSPWYRGSDCVFWALYEGRPEYVGVTVHHLARDADAGEIVLQARPTITPDDTFESLDAKCLSLGARLAVRALERMADGTAPRVPQDPAEGKTYYSRAKTPEKVRELEQRMAGGMIREVLARSGGTLADVPLVE
ncbi:MAG: formyl transferase [Planctomycetota bacterium]